MKYLHVKNLEKYNPGYTDRTLIWCKAYFSMLNSDPEFEMLCEIDKWRFIAFTMLELQIKKALPLNIVWLARKGFDNKFKKILQTVESLGDLIEVTENNDVTQLLETRNESVTQSRVEKSRIEENKVDKRFIPPTPEEVSLYCIERKNNVDPQKFIDFYQSKGWMVGKNKMVDWKACVRTWEKSSREKNGSGVPPGIFREE